MRRYVITKCDNFFITKWDGVLSLGGAAFLSQSATIFFIITKCDGMLLQSAVVCFYKVLRYSGILLHSATVCYYKVRRYVITKCDLFYLLHGLMVCYHKVRQFFYYKVRKVFVVPPGIIAAYNRPFYVYLVAKPFICSEATGLHHNKVTFI